MADSMCLNGNMLVLMCIIATYKPDLPAIGSSTMSSVSVLSLESDQLFVEKSELIFVYFCKVQIVE